jgi:hypothetical protein
MRKNEYKAPLRAWEEGTGVMRRTRLSSGFIGRGLIITLAAALAGVIAVSLVFLVGVRPAAAAPSSLELPFSSGQTWVICQGYNNSQISHFGKQVHALDLSIDRKSALPTSTKRACVGNANASTGKTVFAPSKGTIARTTHSSAYPSAQNDLACIKFDPSPGSALVGHIRPSTMPKVGTSVNAGQPIGAGQSNGPSVLSSPTENTGANGGYAHIHIAVYSSNDCSGTSVPFADANQTRFLCAPDLPTDKSTFSQYYGRYLSRCGTVSSSSTTSAQLRVEVTLPGISPVGTDNHAPLHPQRAVTVDIFNTSWQRVASKTGTVVYNSASGAFTTTLNLGSTWASGKYFVKVRLPNTLQQTMGRYSGSTFSIAPSKTTYLPRTPIFTGDINDDNTINILDYNLGSACWFNTASCSPDYAVASDLNDNGTADQVDYTLWLGSTDGASKNCSNGNCVYNSVWGNFGT